MPSSSPVFLWEGPDLGLEKVVDPMIVSCRTTQVPLRSSLWGIKIYFEYRSTFLAFSAVLMIILRELGALSSYRVYEFYLLRGSEQPGLVQGILKHQQVH